ncbi:MAG TPA: glycosyl hydrolase family 18 protein [Sphingobacteriaceae bacterium]
MKLTLYSLLSLVVFISACKKYDEEKLSDINMVNNKNTASVSYVADNRMKIVAYFPSYRDPAGVSASKYQLITHLYYSFLNPDSNGNLLPVPNITRFNSVIATARANGVKVGIAVAGATNLKIIAASASKRTTLVNNLVNFVVQNNLDGLDMDWEFPRTSDGTHLTYALLMQELSTALHAQNKYLSAAITAGVYSGAVRDGILTEVFNYADFFNIMVYDGLNWDSAQPNQHASYNMAVASLDYWVTTRGMPKEKAILGFPAYGLSNGSSTSVSYRDLVAAGASPSADSFNYNGITYGYNGTATVTSKANLAKLRGNGVMLWEMYGDTNGSVSLLQSAKTALGIGNNPVGIFETFASGVGRFFRAPTYSGSTVGVATTSSATHYVSGSSTHLKVTLNDNTSISTAWRVRLLSGDGIAANNVATSKSGVLYFWLKTSTAQSGATARIWVDDIDGTEQSPTINIINDGAWHKYSWHLANFGGTAVTGNGVLDGANITLDAIVLSQPNTSTSWISYIDDVGN